MSAELRELREENRRIRMERDFLKKSSGVVCEPESLDFRISGDAAHQARKAWVSGIGAEVGARG